MSTMVTHRRSVLLSMIYGLVVCAAFAIVQIFTPRSQEPAPESTIDDPIENLLEPKRRVIELETLIKSYN